ncbi:MAG TPA: hypothetical protein VGN17_08980 [Bryobacteraceae bacterium]
MATKSIGSAVGKQPALNSMRDQQTVRDLLMRVVPEDGGPDYIIPNPAGPNTVSPELQKAIITFQRKNVPARYQDGRVDPNGITIRKLNELARAFSPVDPPQFPVDPVFPPDPPPTPKTTVFYIRMTGSVSGGEVLVGDALFFEMYDPVNYLSVKYKYAGAGVGAGTPATISGKGPWNKFQVENPRQVSNFGTPFAQFTTVGAGPWTDNFLILAGLGENVYLDLITGFDFGGGFSGSVGQFQWYPTTIAGIMYPGLAP